MNLSKQKDRLGFFKELYRKSRDRQAPLWERFERNLAQYKGSPIIDGSREAASVVRNVTYELIESEVSTEIPAPAAEAKHYTEQNDRNAKTVERLCLQLRNELPVERMNDLDERYTYVYGGSVWYVEWDNTAVENGRIGAVRVRCLNPKDFIPEAGIYDVDEMEYCFLRFSTTKNDIARRYGIEEEDLDNADAPADAQSDEDAEVIECFWKDDEGRVCRFVFSGDLILSDTEDYYARKTERCDRCGKKRGFCGCEAPAFREVSDEEEILCADVRLKDGRILPALSPETGADGNATGRMVPTRIPFYRPSCFPIVIRKNVSEENALFGQSDCDLIRPQQQQINKIESRIQQKLMRSAVTPILPDDAEMTLDNSVFGQVIRLRTGEEKDRYGLLDTTPDIRQDIEQSERLYQHAKRILGITDTYLGMSDATAVSGYAKKLQVEQAAGRLESKRKMKQAAYADIDRMIFRYYLAYADEARPLSYKDAFGQIRPTDFNRYDFLVYDPVTGRYAYDDAFLFSVDKNGGLEQQREELWQKNLENLQAGTLGDPTLDATLLHYWQCQERAHYPFARENVEYFRARIGQGQTLAAPVTEEQKGENAYGVHA